MKMLCLTAKNLWSSCGDPYFCAFRSSVRLEQLQLARISCRLHKSHGCLDRCIPGMHENHDLMSFPHKVYHLVITDLVHVVGLLASLFTLYSDERLFKGYRAEPTVKVEQTWEYKTNKFCMIGGNIYLSCTFSLKMIIKGDGHCK